MHLQQLKRWAYVAMILREIVKSGYSEHITDQTVIDELIDTYDEFLAGLFENETPIKPNG